MNSALELHTAAVPKKFYIKSAYKSKSFLYRSLFLLPKCWHNFPWRFFFFSKSVGSKDISYCFNSKLFFRFVKKVVMPEENSHKIKKGPFIFGKWNKERSGEKGIWHIPICCFFHLQILSQVLTPWQKWFLCIGGAKLKNWSWGGINQTSYFFFKIFWKILQDFLSLRKTKVGFRM